MTNAGDEQQWAESLDDDKLTSEYPPDQTVGVDEYGVTAAEETVPESVAERAQREEPEVGEAEGGGNADREVGTLVGPDQGELPDLEDTEVAEEVRGVAAANLDAGDIAFGDDTTRDVAQERVPGQVTSEEAAMHLTEEPPMGSAEPGSAEVGDYVGVEDLDDHEAELLDEVGEDVAAEGDERI